MSQKIPNATVTAQLLDGGEDTRKFYYVEGEEPGLWISMPRAFSHLSVSFEEHTVEFAGVANGGLLLDSTHRPVDTTTAVAKGSYTFIAPAGTELAKAKVGEARPHGAWEGWADRPGRGQPVFHRGGSAPGTRDHQGVRQP
ncbi:hypothetical protein ACKFRS_00235 [Corynebacterium tuberculostearicum]